MSEELDFKPISPELVFKKCTGCDENKLRTNFCKSKAMKDGLAIYCISCKKFMNDRY